MESKVLFSVIGVTLFCIAMVRCSVINDITPTEYEEEPPYASGVQVFKPTRECSLAGGLCVRKEDCEHENLTSKRGLCPNIEEGVECCYKVVPKPSTCERHGGACMDWCNTNLVVDIATDCPADQRCCNLV